MSNGENFLLDLGPQIVDQAQRALKLYMERGGPERHGILLGYHNVLSLMLEMAPDFEITAKEMGLEGVNPDDYLVRENQIGKGGK